MPRQQPSCQGTVTRGTTNPNRLRRVDRYITGCLQHQLRSPDAVVVDLGYGKTPQTTLELHARLTRVNATIRMLGIEIDPQRVQAGIPFENESRRFVTGGFEIPLPPSWTAPQLIRAFNVLRQYRVAQVVEYWQLMQSRLAPDGRIVEGTCDEVGRLASWVTLDRFQPLTFTMSVRIESLEKPSDVAARLPKILIHHNVVGQPIHRFLTTFDTMWERSAAYRRLGSRQRWIAAVTALKQSGWPILSDVKRWRLGEISLPWACIAPTDPD